MRDICDLREAMKNESLPVEIGRVEHFKNKKNIFLFSLTL